MIKKRLTETDSESEQYDKIFNTTTAGVNIICYNLSHWTSRFPIGDDCIQKLNMEATAFSTTQQRY